MGYRSTKNLAIFTSLQLLIISVAVGLVSATGIPSGVHGITVSPALQQISIPRGQPSYTFNTGLANNTSQTVVVQLSARDFTGLNESGAISFLTPQKSNSNVHSLAQNITFELSQFVLTPYQTTTVPITIVNANELSNGGHYAAIIYKVTSAPVHGISNPVSVNEAVSSLVFVTTIGTGTQSLALQYASIGDISLTFPNTVNLVLTDKGNTQTVPTGVVQITNANNAIVSQTEINTTSNLILPQFSREFKISLTSYKFNPPTGYYTFKFYYKTPAQMGYSLYEKKFIFISRQAVILAVVILVLLIVLIAQRVKSIARINPRDKYSA
jgi:hypothetical protein